MATPNQIDTRGATQTSERDEDAASVNSVTNLDIPALIVPDLNNTPLEEAIKDGMKVGPAEFLINTPLLKEHIGVEHLKVFLPSGRLEINSERPIKFVTDCQDSPFPEEVLVSALKTFKIENPITQYIPGDEWPITRHRFLTKQELEDRLAAYCEIGVKYWKYVFELETNSLLTMNNEDRLRANEGLEQSIQRISDRLDEILVILTRDNSRRKAYGKQTYPLPKTKPRMEIVQNAEDAFQMGRRMMTEHDSIVAQAFNEESPDIPNATPAEGHETTGGKETPTQSKSQPGQPVTATITRGKEQHTVNFNFTNKEQHRENSLQDVQRQLSNMAQTTNRATTETDRPDRHDTQANRHGRQDTQQSRWGTRSDRQYEHRNRREYGSSRESDSGASTDWDYCSACGEPGHASRNCVARIREQLHCDKCNKRNHTTANCRGPPRQNRRSHSTPRYDYSNNLLQNNYLNNYPEHTGYGPYPSPVHYGANNYHVPGGNNHHTRNEPSTVYPPQATANNSNLDTTTQMLLTFMAETREETKNRGKHKMLMNHVSYFDGDDKSKCLMWLDNLERIAKEANIPLREAIAAKAGPNILTVLSRHPSAPDAELKRVILENFSNVGTRLEASHYLRRMRLAENKPIVTHNSEYAAVHAVAYNLKPEEQTDQQVFQQYANTLGDHIADKLTRKIFRKVPPSYIRTLKDAMEEGEQLEQVYRQTELARSERISMRETTISDSVNMISDVSSIEYPNSPRGGRFNSTMRQHQYPNQSRGSSYNNSNSQYNISNPYRNGYRRLKRYRHQSSWPKRNVRFEYNVKDKDMMGNIRRTVDFIKSGNQTREAAKKFPKFTNRAIEEVSEDAIETTSIDHIQHILNEDVDLIFDALVIADYIEEEDNA